MSRIDYLEPRFTKSIPENIDDGILYISREYGMAAHRCCCGCGREVITPLSPTDWRLIVVGDVVSLKPSIGNWGFPCRSHYWIKRNRVEWSYGMSDEEIAAGRAYDRSRKERYYGRQQATPSTPPHVPLREGFWTRLFKWIFGK